MLRHEEKFNIGVYEESLNYKIPRPEVWNIFERSDTALFYSILKQLIALSSMQVRLIIHYTIIWQIYFYVILKSSLFSLGLLFLM